MTQKPQYVTIGIAGETLAMPVERVREILEFQPVARLPGAPSQFLGMIDVRGQGVPVIELCQKLGFMPADDDDDTRIIVLTTEIGGEDLAIGVKVDRVYEVTTLDAEDLDAPPEAAAGWRAEFISGIGRRNGAFVTVLDLGCLFADQDMSMFAMS